MPGFTTSTDNHKNSHSPTVSFKMGRQEVIDLGVQYLQEIGSGHICKVCIENGGSCCSGCHHLSDGVGCQLRNTSCTAWLCGFLKYVLYEMDLLQEWNDFWNQVPGQGYRGDFTPEYIRVQTSLHSRNIQVLSEALAHDLKELSRTHITIGFIITLREKIDKNIDHWSSLKKDTKKQTKIKRNIQDLSSHFYRFKAALAHYRQHLTSSSELEMWR